MSSPDTSTRARSEDDSPASNEPPQKRAKACADESACGHSVEAASSLQPRNAPAASVEPDSSTAPTYVVEAAHQPPVAETSSGDKAPLPTTSVDSPDSASSLSAKPASTVDAAVVTIPANSIGLRYLPDFLTVDECAKLITLAEGRGFGRSETNNGVESQRTSFDSSLSSFDLSVAAIELRVAQLTGLPTSHVERLQVVRYEPGQFFHPHYDDTPIDANPRRYTVLVYLNDVEGEGGETDFPLLNIRVKPKRGAALIWENFDARKVRHHDSKHQGLPPKTGVKLVLNCWASFGPIPIAP